MINRSGKNISADVDCANRAKSSRRFEIELDDATARPATRGRTGAIKTRARHLSNASHSHASTMEFLEQYAKNASCFLALMGVGFMSQCRKLWTPMMDNKRWAAEGVVADQNNRAFIRWAALASHMAFILGMIAFSFGVNNIGNAVGLPPALSVFAGMSATVPQLLFMGVTGTSPMGLPDVHGPPLPAKIIVATVWCLLAANYVINKDALYAAVPPSKVLGLAGFAAFVPSAIGAKLRRSGWANQPMDAFKCAVRPATKAA